MADEPEPPSEPVRVDIADGVIELALDSPANRNALSAPLVGALVDRLRTAATDPDVRVVVLTHTGSTFCAGADLAEAAREGGPAAGTGRLVGLLREILTCPKPVVALIDGHVRAGGIGLVGACDLAVVGPATDFAFTESRLGLAPAIISLTVSPRLRDRDVSRYYLTGDRFDAAEAERIGLVTMTAPDPRAALEPLLTSFRACSPQGLAETKALTVAPLLARFDEQADELTERSARLFASEEAQEGIASFREKRPPRWQV
ncbi:MAG: enoyl-CoA hydratase family protein [Actinobacteria bacterium]|nr:enoyl-CoA hydratase family protein [Actinomycetota bacterium]